MLKHLAVETILVEVSSYRRELAASMGVAHCFDPNTTDVLAEVRNLTSGEGADTVIDASGTDVGVNLGLSLTRRQGRFIFAGAGRSAHINPWAHFLEKELTAYGVWYFTDVDYFGILDAYRKGLDVAPLLTHRFALNQAAEAYRLMDEAMTGKAVFVS
jgi:threonine dehydrogenase-like Zn-dependent dehydrogenase